LAQDFPGAGSSFYFP